MKTLTKLVYGSLSLSLASLCSAAITPVLQSVTPDGSDYLWTYSASVGTGIRIATDDFFTVYDFGGLDGGAQAPSGWAYSSADTGPAVFLLAPADDPTIPNVTFEYTGPNIVGPASLGDFSVLSTSDLQVPTAWASYSTRNGGNLDGTFASDMGSTVAPEQITSPNIPEPATCGLVVGLAAVSSLRRRK